MTAEELAARHPRLFHVCAGGALEGIRRHGLLPTSALLTLFEVENRDAIEAHRRPASVALSHPVHGRAVVTDNSPINAGLAGCLDDGLSAADWLQLLNRRVFLWADERQAEGLLGARRNRGQAKTVLVLDTLKLARQYGSQMELSAINSGSTMRRPVRRGLGTFTPLGAHSYAAWRRLRGGLDTVREVTVVGAIRPIDDVLVEVREVRP